MKPISLTELYADPQKWSGETDKRVQKAIDADSIFKAESDAYGKLKIMLDKHTEDLYWQLLTPPADNVTFTAAWAEQQADEIEEFEGFIGPQTYPTKEYSVPITLTVNESACTAKPSVPDGSISNITVGYLDYRQDHT